MSVGTNFVTHALSVSFGSGLPTFSFASICLADVTVRSDVSAGFAVAATEGSGRCYVLLRGADAAQDPAAAQLQVYENSTQMCEWRHQQCCKVCSLWSAGRYLETGPPPTHCSAFNAPHACNAPPHA